MRRALVVDDLDLLVLRASLQVGGKRPTALASDGNLFGRRQRVGGREVATSASWKRQTASKEGVQSKYSKLDGIAGRFQSKGTPVTQIPRPVPDAPRVPHGTALPWPLAGPLVQMETGTVIALQLLPASGILLHLATSAWSRASCSPSSPRISCLSSTQRQARFSIRSPFGRQGAEPRLASSPADGFEETARSVRADEQ